MDLISVLMENNSDFLIAYSKIMIKNQIKPVWTKITVLSRMQEVSQTKNVFQTYENTVVRILNPTVDIFKAKVFRFLGCGF